jgi:hypothetical protein
MRPTHDVAGTMSSLRVQALRQIVSIHAPEPASSLLRSTLSGLICDPSIGPSVDEPEICWNPAHEGTWSLVLGESGSIAGAHTSVALAENISEINRLAARSVAQSHVILHAGSFRAGGRVVAVAGESGAGKSTLVAAAALRGLTYVGDEVCAIDPASGEVLAYPRPIGLRHGGAAALGIDVPRGPLDPYRQIYPWQPPGDARSRDPRLLGLVAVVERRSGPPTITPVPAAEALVRLTRLSLATERIERDVFKRLDWLVRAVPMVTIAHDDPLAAVDALVAHVESLR